MLIKTDGGIYALTRFSSVKNLVCGFSTVSFGNMKPFTKVQLPEAKVNRRKFLKRLGLEKPNIVTAEQVHSNRIGVVSKESSGKRVAGVDGLVTREKNLLLMVFVADCLPLVAFDSNKKIVGIAHAGWQGTLKKLAENLIKAFVELGSGPRDILVGLGPAIGFCHYEVGEDVAGRFAEAGFKNCVLESLSGKIHLDLKQANTQQLINIGVPKTNIDTSLNTCTYEASDFYSYRREKDKLTGEIAAVIGLRK